MAIHIILACGSTLGFSCAYQALSLETLHGSLMAQSRLARLKWHGARVDGMSLNFQQPFQLYSIRLDR